MYEFLVRDQFRDKIKLLFDEILNRFDIMIGNLLNFLNVSGIIFRKILPYMTQAIQRCTRHTCQLRKPEFT